MKNLLITTFGEYNHVDMWLNGKRNFDVALINYDYHDHRSTLIGDCVWLDTLATFKFPGIYVMLKECKELLDYDYFFMPDEDIAISCEDINRLFDKARTLNLDLCCPSIEQSDESFPSWKLFIHEDDVDFTPTNFVEVMCPVFSHRALIKCVDTFWQSHSGWGLDIVWTKLIGDTKSNIGIIHSIVAKHTRMIASGTLYKDLQRKRITPYSEKRRLLVKYNITGFEPMTHKQWSI